MPSIHVIKSLLKQPYTITISLRNTPHTFQAKMIELNEADSTIVLEIEDAVLDIQQYIVNNSINIDIEALSGPPPLELDTFSLDKIPVMLTRANNLTYRLDCKLPESTLGSENKSLIRIPFVLGMTCRVDFELFKYAPIIPGKLKDLSLGGCLVEIQLSEAYIFNIGEKIKQISLGFPNGEVFICEGIIHNVRPIGCHGYAAVGVKFINLSTIQAEKLFHFIVESEREVAYRSGVTGDKIFKSFLFIPDHKEKMRQKVEAYNRDKRVQCMDIEVEVINLAHQLQIGLMYIKNKNTFPDDIFYGCVDNLLSLIEKDRKLFFYALSSIRDEPVWVRHSINVASRMADIIRQRNPHARIIKETVLGILLHNIGKPLLICDALPSLKINMSIGQKSLLKTHVAKSLEKLHEINWFPSEICRDIIQNSNECLDGSGYPAGKKDNDISPICRLISVLKVIEKLSFSRNGFPALAPVDIYRKINSEEKKYDRKWLVEYIKLYGLYPIGCLVKYSGGFLAWVRDVDHKGMPEKIKVVKDIRYPEANINIDMTGNDIFQLGSLESVVDPKDYHLIVSKL